MPQTNFIVYGIMCRRYFQTTCTKLLVNRFVSNYWYCTIHQWHDHFLSVQMPVAFIVGVDGHCHVAHDGLRSYGSYGEMTTAIFIHVFYVDKLRVDLFENYFFIAYGSF